MNNNFTGNRPLSYQDWLNTLSYNADITLNSYLMYLNGWYNQNKNKYSLFDDTWNSREKYIDLIKDLLHLFSEEEKSNLFLTDIDFSNDEDLIYIIPYLASKLKQISQLISQKREELKNTKVKDELIGSQDGLEKVLYEYILKNFTSKPFQWTKIPLSPLIAQFPQLSSISDDFYIEVEDLYDTNNYHDSDPDVPIQEYLDIDSLISKYPFSDLTDEELTALITSRLLLKVAPTPLSKVFNEYLTTSNQLTSLSFFNAELSASYKASIDNQIAANQKYLGGNVFALTAIRNDEINKSDFVLNLPFEKGHNWFYWPSGDKGPDPTTVGNYYMPVPINQSNLILNRTVTGSDYLHADLFFANKDNIIEGAWLQGWRQTLNKGQMSVGLNSYGKTEFIFPWVGFEINSKDLSFKNYVLNDSGKIIYQKLTPELRSKILNEYFSGTLPNSACYDMYLNQTNLIYQGANPAYMSDEADTITVTPTGRSFVVWNETTMGSIQEAYLYKFLKTDIYVKNGLTDILWPIQSFDAGFENLSLTLSADTCVPIVLGAVEPSKSMIGSVAGRTLDESDVIYKLLDNGGTASEAAWLGAGGITKLNPITNAIPIYQTSAVNCAQYIDGPIQPSLYMKFDAGKFTSFIWMDEDTPADDVFYYQSHASTCPYGNSFPHNFYDNQEYQNPNPLNEGKYFPLKQHECTCRAVYYSPIGTQGKKATDFNSMGDLLFADPQGLGENYNFNAWRDTRDLSPLKSPQFSFYQIDGKLDKDVGFGRGQWVNGNKSRMILKTGRRYTYYRSNFRINQNSSLKPPYYFVKYGYKNINTYCGPGYSNLVDLVILIDNSRTEFYNINDVKRWAKKICELALESNPDAQIAIISFAQSGLVLNYLSNDLAELLTAIETIKTPKTYPEWLTDITEGLILANNVLFTNQPPGNDCNFGDISKLCKGLSTQIVNQSKIGKITNCPRRGAAKKIIIFSDGQETENVGIATSYANAIKKNGVDIISIDIGFYALIETVMEEIASPNLYFNLQEYILYSDVDIDRFLINISDLAVGCFPTTPTWCKAYRDQSGNWIGLNVPSDMVLNPGDYFAYVHRSSISYLSQDANSNFDIPSLSFTMNIKLDGWDYYTKMFNPSARGDSFGAKPFWGKVPLPAVSAIPFGGGERVMDEYVILHQPEISNMVLSNGNYITYKNIGRNLINWTENLDFTCTYTDQMWNKLYVKKGDSILKNYLETKNTEDYIIEATNEPSDLYLESFSTLNPTKYIYYLASFHDPYTYSEKLFYMNRCNASYVVFTSGKALDAVNAYANLDNTFYPTVANMSFASTCLPEKNTGNYLTPDKLGVSYFRAKGYHIELDPTKVEYLKSINKDLLFGDPLKYGPRNRGLTKNDQLAPLKIKSINNKWMIEPMSSGWVSGLIIETNHNQKLIPYQSNYEINNNNQIGVSLQKDDFQFWDPKYYNQWTNKKNYPLTFRNELIINNFVKRADSLLVNLGIQDKWKSDIFGNNFGLFKGYGMEGTKYILTESDDNRFITEFGLRFSSEKDYGNYSL